MTTIAASGAVASVILSQCSLQEARLATGEAHRQAEAAEKTLETFNRAVIITSGIEWSRPLERGIPNNVNVNYYNIGKDAVNVHVVRELAFGELSKDFLLNTSVFPKSDTCNIRNYSVGNLATPPATNGVPFYDFGNEVPPDRIDGILDGKYAMAVQGCIFYEDFGKIFWTGSMLWPFRVAFSMKTLERYFGLRIAMLLLKKEALPAQSLALSRSASMQTLCHANRMKA